MTKRLSEGQKKELVENFRSGKSIDVLSKEFDCTKSTISRNLKKNLGDIKYKELILDKSSKEKIEKSIRNIPNIKVTDVNHFSAFDVVKYKKTVFTESSVKELEKRYV